MTNDYTTQEVSKRLKDAGFSCPNPQNAVYDQEGLLRFPSSKGYQNGIVFNLYIPSYSASTLFEWLRINKAGITICTNGPSGEPELTYPKGSFPAGVDYFLYPECSLPDMLAEAIIFVLSQDAE